MAKRSYDTEIIDRVGNNAAMLYEYIEYWCSQSEEVHDGRRWIFHTLISFKEHFPYLSQSTIRRSLKKLEEEGLIVTGNYNKIPFDKTKWYAIASEQIEAVKVNKSKCSKRTNRSVQNEHIEAVKMNTSDVFKMNKSDVFKMNTPITTNNNYRRTNEDITNKGKFTPPSVDEVRDYCLERDNGIDPEAFCDYYISKGWMVGKNKMKDWKASVRTWERNHKQKPQAKTESSNPFTRLIEEEGL